MSRLVLNSVTPIVCVTKRFEIVIPYFIQTGCKRKRTTLLNTAKQKCPWFARLTWTTLRRLIFIENIFAKLDFLGLFSWMQILTYGTIHIWRPRKSSNFKTTLVQLRPKFFHHYDLRCPISNEPPSLNDKQSFKGKHNSRMTIICYRVFPSGRLSFWVSTH